MKPYFSMEEISEDLDVLDGVDQGSLENNIPIDDAVQAVESIEEGLGVNDELLKTLDVIQGAPEITVETARLVDLQLQSIRNRLGATARRIPGVSVESYSSKKDLKVATEAGILNTLQTVVERIIEWIKEFIAKIGDFFFGFEKRLKDARARIDKLKMSLNSVGHNAPVDTEKFTPADLVKKTFYYRTAVDGGSILNDLNAGGAYMARAHEALGYVREVKTHAAAFKDQDSAGLMKIQMGVRKLIKLLIEDESLVARTGINIGLNRTDMQIYGPVVSTHFFIVSQTTVRFLSSKTDVLDSDKNIPTVLDFRLFNTGVQKQAYEQATVKPLIPSNLSTYADHLDDVVKSYERQTQSVKDLRKELSDIQLTLSKELRNGSTQSDDEISIDQRKFLIKDIQILLKGLIGGIRVLVVDTPIALLKALHAAILYGEANAIAVGAKVHFAPEGGGTHALTYNPA